MAHQTDLILFNLANIATVHSHIIHAHHKNRTSKKRKYNDLKIENNLFDEIPGQNAEMAVQPPIESSLQAADSAENEIFVVNRTIIAHSKLPLDAKLVADTINDEKTTTPRSIFMPDILLKYNKQENLLELFSKQKYKLKSLNLLSLTGPSGPSSASDPPILSELGLLKAKNENIVIRDFHLVLALIESDIEGVFNVSIKINYRISVKNSVFFNYPLDVIHSLNEIILNDEKKQSKAHKSAITPQIFYNTITQNTTKLEKTLPMTIPDLQVDLLGFQNDSINWLLKKENVKYNHDTHSIESSEIAYDELFLNNNELIQTEMDKISFGWKLCFLSSDAISFWYNKYTGNCCTQEFAKSHLISHKQDLFGGKGLLCEEMGLGKTVELCSLILLNQRPIKQQDLKYPNTITKRLTIKSKTTLIITPDSILGQWAEELERLCPILRVFHYQGASQLLSNLGNVNDVAKMLSDYDVVLCSYQVLSKELHYALYNPDMRPTRSKKRRQERGDSRQTDDDVDAESNRPKTAGSSGSSEANASPSSTFDEEEISPGMKGGQDSFYDYSSPLMLIEFWRVVLDEVQMISSKISNAFKTSRLIPRVHGWGVSGTPIKKDMNDLKSILNFLKFNPFVDEYWNSDKMWNYLLTDNSDDFIKLFGNLSIRHTKDMVKDDITLPLQKRVLLTLPFTAIEQDNYNNLLEECLTAICLDAKGEPILEDWEPTPTIYTYMRSWLVRLRQVCCNSQIGKLNFGTGRRGNNNNSTNNGLPKLQTVEEVLNNMLEENENMLSNAQRKLSLLYLERGQLEDFDRHPELGIKIWNEYVSDIEGYIETLRVQLVKTENESTVDNDDDSGVIKMKLRGWLNILHRYYFNMATSHYHVYNPESYNRIVIEDEGDENISDELKYPSKDDIPDEELGEFDLGHRLKERSYYDEAEKLRRDLLSESIRRVNDWILRRGKSMSDQVKFIIPRVDLKRGMYRGGIESNRLFSASVELIRRLNVQTEVINSWFQELNSILMKPLLDTGSTPDGEEYATSLDDQEKCHCYLDVIKMVLQDRSIAINGITPDMSHTITLGTVSKDQRTLFYNQLMKVRDEVKPVEGRPNDSGGISMKRLISICKDEINKLADGDIGGNKRNSYEVAIINELIGIFTDIYDSQRKPLSMMKKEIDGNLNNIYNHRLEYFKQLQQISDTVTAYQPRSLAGNGEININVNREFLSTKQQDVQNEMSQITTRYRYLQTLQRKAVNILDKQEEAQKELDEVAESPLNTNYDEDDKFCIICRSSITIGSLTKCGHQYCKDCLDTWLKNRNTCPMCKSKLNASKIYNFTYTRPELKVKLVNDDKSNDLFSIYEPMDARILNEILNGGGLKNSYGSKVDLILKQVLWLKKNEPDVQIVIFSQWTDLLYIIGIALKNMNIRFLGSNGTLLPEFGSGRRRSRYTDVNRFRNDKDITCFLLNAKAQSSGLTLVNATHVFLCEPLINTSLELQAISRVHRIGQKKPTTVWMFIIENTVEESIFLLSTKKRLDLIDEKHSSKRDKNVYKKAKEIDLTMVDSIELTKTNDQMLTKKSGEGEAVLNEDLWSAFFSR